jgi:hypothetical protein
MEFGDGFSSSFVTRLQRHILRGPAFEPWRNIDGNLYVKSWPSLVKYSNNILYLVMKKTRIIRQNSRQLGLILNLELFVSMARFPNVSL